MRRTSRPRPPAHGRLDDFATAQTARDDAIYLKKKAIAEQREKEEARAAAEAEKKLKVEAERLAKAEEAAAARAAAAEAKAAEKKAAKTSGKAEVTQAKANKYGTVQTVSKQAERIAARKASGEDAPKLFGQ